MSEFDTLSVERDGRLSFLTFERPDKLNALNPRVVSELRRAVDDLADLDDNRAVVVRGEGRAFVAGADIEAMAEMSPEEGRAFCRDGHSAMRALEQLPVPVLAAVDGFALGGGLELAVSCDLIYASGRATFGLPEVGLGVIPGFGGTQRLARFVGWQHAKEIVFTGNNFDADRAESIDLVCDVFPPDDFDSCVRDRAETIASRGPRAIREAKRVMNAGRNASLETGLALERGAFSDVFDTEDRVEGMEAFVEGRDPDFSGK